MSVSSHSPKRSRSLLAAALLLLGLLLAAASVAWRGGDHAPSAGTPRAVPDAAQRDAARRAWAAMLDQEDASLDEQRRQACRPVDEYFDVAALPHVADFLADFSGLFYDTPRFVYKWLADRVRFRGYSDRVNQQVKEALQEHLGFPQQFNTAVRESLERFHTFAQQRDAQLREQAYTLLAGAGADVDRARLDALLEDARDTAQRTAFEQGAREAAIDFGGVMTGKEVVVQGLQSLILARVMVAVGTRMGVVTAGAGAAGATAGAGTATGIGAAPAWVLAAAEFAVAVIVDLAISRWLESKAEAVMRKHLNEVRDETHQQLRQYIEAYAQSLRQQRLRLIDLAFGP